MEAERLSWNILDILSKTPGGENIKRCIQCGTCSATCPVAYAMDLTPRELWAYLRAGMVSEALKGNTIWLCVSCYSCTVRCPMQIKFTEVMYELKRLALERGLLPGKETGYLMSQQFSRMADKYGRISETRLSMSYSLRTSLTKSMRFVPVAIRLMRRGRFPLRQERIRGAEEMRIMNEYLKGLEEKTQ